MLKNLNRYSRLITQKKDHGAAQAMLYALGLSKEDLKKPQIAIGSMWFDGNPCNSKLNVLSDITRKSINDRGYLGMRFNTIGVSDGMSMGTEGMRYSLPSRELITDSIESIVRAQHYDGLVCIPGCDKNLPASAMALARLNRPGFIIYGGSMQPSYFNNQKLDIVSAFESYGKFLNKDISEDEHNKIVENSCHKGCGSCSGLYTANTMATILETMGLTIPNSSSNFSMSDEKILECKNSQIIIDTLLRKDIKPLDIMTKEAFINAIKMLYLTGGSTNGVIHLLAIAKTAKIDLKLDDFKNLEDIPVLLNMKPHGTNVMHDLYKLGGTSSFLKYLIENNIINGDCLTVTGKSLWENVHTAEDLDFNKQDVVLPLDSPFKQSSHIKILKGNLAPDGCVSKINSNNTNFTGKALVFDTENEFLDSLEKGLVKRDNFIILRYQGETIGCPEMLKPTSALSGYFNNDPPPLATDGRFSGGSKGVLVAHLPDAYKKGNLTSSIKNGTMIELDLKKGKINILAAEEMIEIGDTDLAFFGGGQQISTDLDRCKHIDNKFNKRDIELDGYLKKYSKLVTDIESGYLT